MIFSYFLANKLLIGDFNVSLDLGLTKSAIKVKGDRYIFPDGQFLKKEDLLKIKKKDKVCFTIIDNVLTPVQLFSEDTNRFYKLVPTADWPTLEISGIRMHVTKSMTPKQDTEQKISFVSPCTGNVLDTCTGLGYTAIMAATTADRVTTFEKDPNVVEIQRWNPYSKELFTNQKIKRMEGDIFEEIPEFDCEFDVVIHDPPRQALATLLYSGRFYEELYYVLKKPGKLYHYTGDPGSKARGQDIRTGVTNRLERAGFRNIKRVFNGIIATKE